MTAALRAAAAVALLLAAACTAPAPPRGQAGAGTAQGAACAPPQGAIGTPTATTIDVIEQAYLCILGNHHSAATLDARSLLTAGFAALTQELGRAGRDLPEAVMPPLTGDRKADWAAFEAAYVRITDRVPDLRDRLAVATLEAMVASLGDNHASWTHEAEQRHPDHYDGDGYGLGLTANVTGAQAERDPGSALPPLFITEVEGGAARAAGLRPGDVIESINGSAPFIDGRPTPAIAALYPRYPQERPVRLELSRPGTGLRWSVTLKPGLYRRDPATLRLVQPKVLDGGVAYVRVLGFASGTADRVLRAIAEMRKDRSLSGVVLDLRGNGGGSPREAVRLVSAFAHGKVTAYLCAADGGCEASRTDDSVELVGLPLVVLTDRGCASACEHFGSAVKDLRAGRLVGTRTAGAISGPAQPYLLRNNTVLTFPGRRHLGPNREVIDRIGVPPDHHVPLTAKDAAAGRDPALAKAVALLHE
jgi:Periplasmic protease